MKKNRCYIYTRVSTAAQVEGYSLAAQQERLRQFAEYKGLEIAGEYCDAGKSGKSITGRPEFQKMLNDVVNEKDNISYVLVFKLSRFGRNAADVVKSMQLLMDYDINLVSVDDSIDSSTQGGRIVLTILSAVAEMERENITVQFRSGRMQKMKMGGWIGGPVPYGYRAVDKELVVEPKEAEMVKLIYELYLRDDMKANTVLNYLNHNGYRRIKNGKEVPFTDHVVKRVLDNPIYCGMYYYNRRTNKGLKNPRELICVKGTHEAIISKEQWERARDKRERLSYKPNKIHDPERISLLAGIARCPVCGCGLYSEHKISKNKNHGGYYKPTYGYACQNHRKANGRVCSFKRQYNQEKVDGAVYEIVSKLHLQQDFENHLIKALGDNETVEQLEQNIKRLRKELYQREQQNRKLGAVMDHLDIMAEDYNEQYADIAEQMDVIYDEIDSIEEAVLNTDKQLKRIRKGIYSAGQIKELLGRIPKMFEHMTCAEKREMYRC